MSTDTLLIATVAVLIGAFVGGFIAMSIARKQVQTISEALAQQNNALEQERESNTRLQAECKTLTDQYHNQALDLKETQTKLQAAHTENTRISDDKAMLTQKVVTTEATLNATKEQLSAANASIKANQQNIEQLNQQLNHQSGELIKSQTEYTQLLGEHAQLKTTLDEREKSNKKQLEQLEVGKQNLTKEFENLANKIFEEKGKSFSDTSKNNIDSLLKPFKLQIEGFQKRINDIHDASTKGNANLNAEIHKVLDIGLKMSAEANNLTSALKGNSQQRGAWGEAQLERTLEMGGLIKGDHYDTQNTFKDDEHKNKQTDFIIKLPDNKNIIIDSKVSLVAYDKAIAADTEEAHQAAMAEHCKAVKKHIDDLHKKDYTSVAGMRSPGFVLMFMPIEPAYIDALKNNKDLFAYGYDKGVVLVSHTTLIPILRTVANLWAMEKSNTEAREISKRAGDIYNNVCTLAERLAKLGNTMNTASKQYDDTVKSLVGKMGLHGKVERFQALSSKAMKSLPALEEHNTQFDTEKLEAVAVQEEQPAAMSIPLPSLEEQKQVVEDIENGADTAVILDR